jgi:hypothetical protein
MRTEDGPAPEEKEVLVRQRPRRSDQRIPTVGQWTCLSSHTALSPVSALESALSPTYIRWLPTMDGWGRPILYWSNLSSYWIISTGADRTSAEMMTFCARTHPVRPRREKRPPETPEASESARDGGAFSELSIRSDGSARA